MSLNSTQVKTVTNGLAELQNTVPIQVIGQEKLITRVLVALLADGQVSAAGGRARASHAHYARVQFTPDRLPADLIGTQIYNPHSHSFSTPKGPIFANLLIW